MHSDPFLRAALVAAARGWSVFPLVPGEKTPAIRGWEQRATVDRRQIHRWWAGESCYNIGVATGKSGLVVIDLDGGRGDRPPERFAGAHDGHDVLAMLADAAGVEMPSRTYTVTTPSGCHLYFRTPPGIGFRNSAGLLGWRVDSRASGGYVVAAGSVREQGAYTVARHGAVAELPVWLARRLTPPSAPELQPPMGLPRRRSNAYVRAIVEREAHAVATAQTGTRHHSLLKAARTLGRLVGGDELVEDDARAALLDAAAGHVGVDGCTAAEVEQTIADGIGFGRQLPRRITDAPRRAIRDQPPATTGLPRARGTSRAAVGPENDLEDRAICGVPEPSPGPAGQRARGALSGRPRPSVSGRTPAALRATP